ncbi:MAG TPA: DUF6599 family protein [Pyrinomonadaceae bacterium]|jgi:hypothetical protein
MRTSFVPKTLPVILSVLLGFTLPFAGGKAENRDPEPTAAAGKLLPDKLGDFRAVTGVNPYVEQARPAPTDELGKVEAASRTYKTPDGNTIIVRLRKLADEATAYSLVTAGAADQQKLNGLGTASWAGPGAIVFCKGPIFVWVVYAGDVDAAAPLELAHQLAATLDAGTGVLPPLVEHLPAGMTQQQAVYAVSLPQLRAATGNQPVLDALSFAGGTEAVAARYAQGQLVIVEFATPQLAGDADAALARRVAELRAQGQGAPSLYKRVGNYAVFVFGAPSEQAAAALAGQVKYEKVVQWLGEDPHRYERANRFWLNMSTSLIVNTVKATGLAILFCLGIGGLFGGVIFRRRRAHVARAEKYTDAGGMMRLNLDDLAAEEATPRLLPPRQE